MSRRGPMSIEDHRAWVATYGNWTPPKPRPGEKLVEHVMGQLATALERSEAEIVDAVIARGDYNILERARVEVWARQALTIVVLAAERAASSGTRLSDNVLFHELASRFSPGYAKGMNDTPARRPSEMKPSTLETARGDLKAAGFRLQALFKFATDGVAGWYKTRMTRKGRRAVLRGRPLKGEALNEARALLGLPPIERVHGYLRREGDPGPDLKRARLESLNPLVFVPDARVTGEVEYETIRTGSRMLGVIGILDQTRLRLNIDAAHVELSRLEHKREEARAKVAAVIQPHQRVTKDKRLVWSPPWTSAEIVALEEKSSYEQQYRALKPVVDALGETTGSVIIETAHRQAINRRLHATSFWPEHAAGDSSVVRECIPESYDAETGEVDEGPFDLVTKARGRLFTPGSLYETEYDGQRVLARRYGDHFEGVDVSSSQYQILSVLLNEGALEEALAVKSAHQIAAERIYPGDPKGPDRAKHVLVAGGYGSAPDRINWKTKIPLEEVRHVLSSLGPSIGRYLEYTRKVAYAVDPMKGFTFTDPFDGVEVVWRPIVAREKYVKSDNVQIVTYVPANGGRVNQKKLSQQIAPMLVHTLDSAFSGLVVEGLHRRGVKDIIALFDCWLIPSRYLQEYNGNPRLFDEVIEEAGAAWLPMLGPIYDALLEYKDAVSEPAWMESLKKAWEARLAAGRWPRFRTKRVTTYEYE